VRRVLKTLYLTTQGTMARLEQDAIRVERPAQPAVRVPVRHVDRVVAHGHVTLTTELIGRLSGEGAGVVYLSRAGRFVARVEGPSSGNVLLRRAQHRAVDDPERVLALSRAIVVGKLKNSRVVLLDAAKDRTKEAAALRDSAAVLRTRIEEVPHATSLDHVRGIEGNGAREYFTSISGLASDPRFSFETRSRRPPRDPMNALLSYMYALLRIRCAGALEAAGLDPQVGFLHGIRPGRPALALDLMEEFRPIFVDRPALSMVNRRQLTRHDFLERPGGSWELTEPGRTTLLQAWDGFLDQEVPHGLLGLRVSRRYVIHLQALVLARHLRGELDQYVPFQVAGR
jgi:CRISPR-associated protein Cas1